MWFQPGRSYPKRNTIIEDFPWLWALQSIWTTHWLRDVRISQNMEDLKTVLVTRSADTSFGLWCVKTFAGDGGAVQRMERTPQEPGWIKHIRHPHWCEAIMAQTIRDSCAIQHVVLAIPESHDTQRNITIFRHPQTDDLAPTIEWTARLIGSNAVWRFPPIL